MLLRNLLQLAVTKGDHAIDAVLQKNMPPKKNSVGITGDDCAGSCLVYRVRVDMITRSRSGAAASHPPPGLPAGPRHRPATCWRSPAPAQSGRALARPGEGGRK